jgi:hypothetical protein
MTSLLNKYGVLIFSIVSALIIVASAWLIKGAEDNDTWLYIFSIWMILFSAFEIHSSVKITKVSNIAHAALVGASAIVVGAWWMNGAEHLEIFLSSVAAMIVAFFATVSQQKKYKSQ